MSTEPVHRVRHALLLGALLAILPAAALSAGPDAWIDAYREPASRLIGAALADRFAWHRIAEVTDTFGPRLSGTPALDAAIEWALATMKADGLENVRAEPVMVPRWVRGRESLHVVAPFPRPLVMLGLGGSVGTPADGLEADAIVVSSFDELHQRAADVRGRIVVFDVPYTTYGETVRYRSSGASRAAALGAAAALIRSVGPMGLRTPHTGGLQYAPDAPTIPAAAVSAEDAAALHRLQSRGVRLRLKLTMEARTLPDVDSANVVGEIVGRERPHEIVALGCHYDSWDVGTGASDDAGGCIVTWEAVRLMKRLGLRPRRTVRVVLFTNEENGLRGGLGYRDRHRDQLANHVLMLESDIGLFDLQGFGFTGSDEARKVVNTVVSLLNGIGLDRVLPSGGGADIGPSVEAGGIPSMSLNSGGDYFLVHHTPADTVDRIDPFNVSRAVGAVAVMAYVIADLPERLGEVAGPSNGR